MSTYARIDNGTVAELFTPPDGVSITDCFHSGLTWVEATAGVAPGWTYNDTAFAAPPAPPAPPPVTTMTPLVFMARFTDAETTAIHTAAMGNAALFGWLLQCAAATDVDLTDPRTKAGLDALVSAGLLTAEREAVILAP